MNDRGFAWFHWVAILTLGAFALPILIIPAGMLLLVLLPVALVAVPALSVSWLARA